MAFFRNRSFLVKMVKETPSGPVEEDVLDDIKTHFDKYKVAYITGGITAAGVGFAGFTYLIMRGHYTGIQGVPESGIRGVLDGPAKVAVSPLAFFSHQTNNVVAVIERNGRGHPGYPVWCPETNEYWPTQNAVAKAWGVYPSLVSGHLNGKFPDIDGKQLQRVKV